MPKSYRKDAAEQSSKTCIDCDLNVWTVNIRPWQTELRNALALTILIHHHILALNNFSLKPILYTFSNMPYPHTLDIDARLSTPQY